jgi:Domain of unknown function (DUF4307)
MDFDILAQTTDTNREGRVSVTETHATTAASPPVFPPGRYGRRRAPRRRRMLPWVLGAVLAVVTVGLAVRLYGQYGDPTYDAQVLRYTEITDRQIVVEFRVNVPSGGAAVCAVRARSAAGAEVGRAEVRLRAEPGRTSARTVYRLATTARPVTGEVVRCRAG